MASELECGDISNNNNLDNDVNINIPENLVRYRYSSSQVLSLLMRDLDHSDDINIDLPEAEEMSDIDAGDQGLDQDFDDIGSDDASEHESVNTVDTENDEDNDQSDDFYLSRDGKTKFFTTQRRHVRGRLAAHNITRVAAGPRNCQPPDTELDSFFLYFSVEMLDVVLKYTNLHGKLLADAEKKQFTAVTKDEMLAFIGLLLYAGLTRAYREPIESLFYGPNSRAIYRATMTDKRFKEILRFLRFDDKSTRADRVVGDKAAAVSELFDMFVENCKKYYMPSEATIDEQLVGFRGHCPFRVYMASKPDKYGLKVWILADAQTFVCCNAQLYRGKTGQHPEVRQGPRVVHDLCSYLYDSGLNVTCDNFFPDLQLAEELKQKKLTLVATVRVGRKDVPKEFMPARRREVLTTMCGFTETGVTMVSYVPKRNRAVVLMSTLHSSVTCDPSNEMKPNIILHYNRTKSGVDVLDKLVKEYTCKRGTRRWTVIVFYNIIDLAAYNAFVTWLSFYPAWKAPVKGKKPRREFLMELAQSLIKPAVYSRLQKPHMQLSVRQSAEMCGIVMDQPKIEGPSKAKARRRCFLCQRSDDKKVSAICDKCEKSICRIHSVTLCDDCYYLKDTSDVNTTDLV